MNDLAIDLDFLTSNLHLLDDGEKRDLAKAMKKQDEAERIEDAHGDFLQFVQECWPGFINGPHHRMIANAFNDVINGDCKRLIINMAPRHTKSMFASVFLPAFFLGHFPDRKIIQASNTQKLASGFGRQVRNLVAFDPEYRKIFPDTALAPDSTAANSWHTKQKGEYFAIGIDGRVAGHGADLFVIDDPHDEQEARLGRDDAFDPIYDYYEAGPRQRLQPDAAIVVVMTRWSKRDLSGRLIKIAQDDPNADQWTQITLPAIIDEHTDSERATWPQYWRLEELQRTRASIVNVSLWQGPFQQNPTSAESAILKRDLWETWDEDEPPSCKYVLQSWDTAMSKKEKADFNAVTTWGVFETTELDDNDDEHQVDNVILLDAYRERCDYPELKKMAKEFYDDWRPDELLIESKNSGTVLIQDLRMAGFPVSDFTPTRGSIRHPNDKIARANMVTPLLHSGRVWAPDRKFAKAVIEECHDFDHGENDDYVDSTVQALLRLRDGGLIRPAEDVDDFGDELKQMRRKADYY